MEPDPTGDSDPDPLEQVCGSGAVGDLDPGPLEQVCGDGSIGD